jgi:hypothetical protein
LADLYDPLTMPAELLKAHQALDHAVDRAYRAAAFLSERERVEYLFQRYEALVAPLAPAGKAGKRRPKDNFVSNVAGKETLKKDSAII